MRHDEDGCAWPTQQLLACAMLFPGELSCSYLVLLLLLAGTAKNASRSCDPPSASPRSLSPPHHADMQHYHSDNHQTTTNWVHCQVYQETSGNEYDICVFFVTGQWLCVHGSNTEHAQHVVQRSPGMADSNGCHGQQPACRKNRRGDLHVARGRKPSTSKTHMATQRVPRQSKPRSLLQPPPQVSHSSIIQTAKCASYSLTWSTQQHPSTYRQGRALHSQVTYCTPCSWRTDSQHTPLSRQRLSAPYIGTPCTGRPPSSAPTRFFRARDTHGAQRSRWVVVLL